MNEVKDIEKEPVKKRKVRKPSYDKKVVITISKVGGVELKFKGGVLLNGDLNKIQTLLRMEAFKQRRSLHGK